LKQAVTATFCSDTVQNRSDFNAIKHYTLNAQYCRKTQTSMQPADFREVVQTSDWIWGWTEGSLPARFGGERLAGCTDRFIYLQKSSELAT